MDFQDLHNIGIVGVAPKWLDDQVIQSVLAQRQGMAYDSAPLITQANNGVPVWATMYTSPEVIKVLLSPSRAEQVSDPVKRGDFGVGVAAFPMQEDTGTTAPYGDYSSAGVSDANFNWPTREEYRFQTVTQVGDLETSRLGMAQISATTAKHAASATTLKRGHNKIWFYGVEGMKNYGLLNDPNLPAPITPIPDAANKILWADKGANAVYNDILALFAKLQDQTQGLAADGIDMDIELVLAVSNKRSTDLSKINEYGVQVKDMLKKAFPNMRFVVAPEYSTASGELMQLIAPSLEGQSTLNLGYTELMHAHGLVRALSSIQEKKSAGNFGAVIFQPFAIAQMLGL